MARLSMGDRETLFRCAIKYNNWIAGTIQKPVQDKLHLRPQELVETFEDLKRLMERLRSNHDEGMDLDQKLTALLKRSIIHTRRHEALSIEERSTFTFNQGIRESLEDEMRPVSEIMKSDWFRETEAAKPVRLTDFLSIHYAEELLRGTAQLTLQERTYDEKFHLLLAPSLFLADLSYYRTVCELRAVPVSVAYIDIDDFKEFNTEYGEPQVDRDVLPRFMSALEAHLFYRGKAYRYGGDEYVAILPNTSCDKAKDLFLAFQKELETIEYSGIPKKLSISVGIYEVSKDCALTDHEVEVEAAHAKSVAKKRGKNCIVTMTGANYGDRVVQLE